MESQKHLFNIKENVHYLNCAYKAPLMKSSEEAAIGALMRERNPADYTPSDFFEDASVLRSNFGKLVNGNPANVVSIPSTSYGFASALNNTPAKTNGKAITIKDEFPSGYFSLVRWCEENNNSLEVISPDENLDLIGESWNEKLLSAINKNTSVVLISTVHWMNGIKFDLEQIGSKCREVNAVFILDGTQSVGVLPMDVELFKVDALVCASYKWMFGPYSLGMSYLGDRFSNGIPLEESWMNRTNAVEFSTLTNYDPQYKPKSAMYNVGQKSNMILTPMLIASINQILSWDVGEMQLYCKNLIQPLKEYMSSLGIEMEREKYFSNHLFSLRFPPTISSDSMKESLERNNIKVSIRGKFIRVSVNVFNETEDIQKLIHAIESVR